MFPQVTLVHIRELGTFKLEKILKWKIKCNVKPKPALKTLPCALGKNSQ